MLAPALRPIFPGAVIGEKYRVERVIASGGQGTVVEATHLRLRHPVAIKFPHLDEAHQSDRWARLFREARAAVRLRGEHVARIIDVDVDVVDGSPFIVMEYLRGADLRMWLAERGALPHEEAVGLVLQACDGVAEAHDLGIVHRDLKPSNLFLVDRGGGPPQLKILDFGMAKSVGPRAPDVDDPDLTEPLLVLGTPRYMSPEQARNSRAVDLRTDIWSLGVILHEFLTGRPPFRARSRAEVLAQVLLKNPTPITLLRPDTPPELERVLLRCLQKAPEHRFSSVRELAGALAPFAAPWAEPAIARLASGAHAPLARAAPVLSGEAQLDCATTNELATPLPRVATERPAPDAPPAPSQAGPGSAVTRVLPAQGPQPIIQPRKSAWTGAIVGGAALAAIALVISWRVEGTLQDRTRTSLPPALASANAVPPQPSGSRVMATPSVTVPTVEPMPTSVAAEPLVWDASRTSARAAATPATSERPRSPFARGTRKAARRARSLRAGARAVPAPKIASIDRSRPLLGSPNESPSAAATVADMDNPLDGRK